MTVPEDMAERHGRMLARFAELSLTLAEDVHAAAAAAPEPDQKARLAEAFHRLGRALRQSIALEAKFVRDRARDVRAAEADAAETAARAVRRRHDQVRAELERQIYGEVDPSEAHAWLADAVERLETEALYDGFTTRESVDDHIARLAADLGLTGEATRDYTPRACRPRFPGRYRPWEAFGADEDDDADEEDAGEDDADEDDVDEEGADAKAPVSAPEGETETAPPPDPPPEPLPEPPPEPPPRPPDPEPHVASWDRHPNAQFPGGSGY